MLQECLPGIHHKMETCNHWVIFRLGSLAPINWATILQILGEVEHEDRLGEVDSGSPIPPLSSSASPAPLSLGQNDDLQGTDRSSKVIVHESCLVKGVSNVYSLK